MKVRVEIDVELAAAAKYVIKLDFVTFDLDVIRVHFTAHGFEQRHDVVFKISGLFRRRFAFLILVIIIGEGQRKNLEF